MEDSKVNLCLSQLSGKIPNEQTLTVKNALRKASDEVEEIIACLSLHNPVIVLLLSIFLGGLGVDRFVIGDVGLGVAKLLLGWLTFGIWPLIDIFFCYKKAKQKNLQKILTAIS